MEIPSLRWQEGVEAEVTVGCSVRELLCQQLHIPEEYLEKRIAVIFLEGSPVDDIDKTLVANGSVIALSAQMPGLVGAAMTRKGLISPLRSSISAETDTVEPEKTKGTIRLKLFNALIEEIGSSLSQYITHPNDNHR